MDMINMNIIESAMIAIAKEMGINVQKQHIQPFLVKLKISLARWLIEKES